MHNSCFRCGKFCGKDALRPARPFGEAGKMCYDTLYIVKKRTGASGSRNSGEEIGCEMAFAPEKDPECPAGHPERGADCDHGAHRHGQQPVAESAVQPSDDGSEHAGCGLSAGPHPGRAGPAGGRRRPVGHRAFTAGGAPGERSGCGGGHRPERQSGGRGQHPQRSAGGGSAGPEPDRAGVSAGGRNPGRHGTVRLRQGVRRGGHICWATPWWAFTCGRIPDGGRHGAAISAHRRGGAEHRRILRKAAGPLHQKRAGGLRAGGSVSADGAAGGHLHGRWRRRLLPSTRTAHHLSECGCPPMLELPVGKAAGQPLHQVYRKARWIGCCTAERQNTMCHSSPWCM